MSKRNAFVEKTGRYTVALLGCGVSNAPLARFFLSRGNKVTLRDAREASELPDEILALTKEGLSLRLGKTWLDGLTEKLILRSPGMRPERFPAILEASAQGAHVTTEAGLFLEAAHVPVLGVTGSDGKSTTATLTAAILRESGYRVFLGGNIGTPLLSQIDEMKNGDVAVMELSSFQLYDAAQSPTVAAVTNLSENHLNWHADMAEYRAAKARILRRGSYRVLSADCDALLPFYESGVTALFSTKKSYGELRRLHGDVPVAYVEDGFFFFRHKEKKEALLPVGEFALSGDYNRKNLLTAYLLARPYIRGDALYRAATAAKPLPHRMELVAEKDGVTYYDSSIDSSPARSTVTLEALSVPAVVIMGGRGKNLSYDALPPLLAKKARAVVLTGENASELSRVLSESDAFRESGVPFFLESDMDAAVRRARRLSQKGDAVLLSPAATSFDRYKNFAARGNAFKKAVEAL